MISVLDERRDFMIKDLEYKIRIDRNELGEWSVKREG